MIYKTLWGSHVDLSKIVAIDEPVFAYFYIHYQLLDKPIKIITGGNDQEIWQRIESEGQPKSPYNYGTTSR